MTRRRTFIRRLIVETVFFVILYAPLTTGLFAFFGDMQPVFLSLLLAVPFYCMFAVRGTRSFALFFGAHAVLVAWPLILPAIWTPAATLAEAIPNAPLSQMLIGLPHGQIAPLRTCWFVFLLCAALRSIITRLRGAVRASVAGIGLGGTAASRHGEGAGSGGGSGGGGAEAASRRGTGTSSGGGNAEAASWHGAGSGAVSRDSTLAGWTYKNDIRETASGSGFTASHLFSSVGLLVVLSLIAGYYGMDQVTSLNAVWAFMIILGYLLYNQSYRIDESLAILSGSGKKPVAAIIRFNNGILSLFFIPLALFAALSPWLPLANLAKLLGAAGIAALRGIFAFARWVRSLFPDNESEPVAEMPPAAQDMGMPPIEQAASPAWMELLDAIIRVLLAVISVAFIAALLAFGVYRLYKRFIATRGADDGGAAAEGDTSEYIGPRLAAKPLSEFFGGLLHRLSPKSEGERIRRVYYKKVRRHIRRGTAISRADTPGEIEAKLRPAEDIGGLTSLYERARYGAHES